MNAARAHAALHNFKATTLAQDDVRSWNADILEMHFTVPERCVCSESEFQQLLSDLGD